MRLLLLSTGGGGGNILRSLKAMFEQDLALIDRADGRYAKRLREAVATRFLDTNEFSLADVPPAERLLIGPRTTGRLGARHNPDVARQALEESRSEVEQLLENHAIVVLIGTGGKGTGAGTMFPLARLAREHRKLVLPIFVRPSFERHEVDKRRYDHALSVIERFDAAGIRLMEILNDRGYTDASPQPQSAVWERMNLPIARGLRGLIYVLWELSQVDPSDLSMLFAGHGRLRIGYADIDAPADGEPGVEQVEAAARRCWENPYYAFSRPPGTSLVCIQGEWSNVVDARIKGHLAELAMSEQGEASYTPLYARAACSPRPWGVTMLLADHTGAHAPLDVDWSFARAGMDAARRHVGQRPTSDPPAVPAARATHAPTPSAAGASAPAVPVAREDATGGARFATLLEFAVAVNRSDPAAVALARDEAECEIPIDGADVRKLLGTLWFRDVVARLSPAWQTRLFEALRPHLAIPNHGIRLGRHHARLSELGSAQLREALAAPSVPEAVRQDLALVATIAQLWGDEALRRCQWRDIPDARAASGLAGILRGFRPRT